MLLLSALAHSGLGGAELTRELKEAGVKADLIRSVLIGWHFGGLAMGVFGTVTLATFLRRQPASTLPTLLIAGGYLGFGLIAITLTGNPFFSVFLVPGSLPLAASWPTVPSATTGTVSG
jgi:hypothetical protein